MTIQEAENTVKLINQLNDIQEKIQNVKLCADVDSWAVKTLRDIDREKYRLWRDEINDRVLKLLISMELEVRQQIGAI